MSRWPVANGHQFTPELRKAVLCIDNETFDEIRARAVKGGRSFAAEVREIIEIGLETLRQDEAA